MPNANLPSLPDIISKLPHRVLTGSDVVRHCNAECSTPQTPTPETAHSWSCIFEELVSQGWASNNGWWMPPKGETP